MNLDTIIDILHREGRAATYGAVASLVGTIPRNVMEGRPRDPKNSWVVNGMTLLPTHYGMHEMGDKDLKKLKKEKDKNLKTLKKMSHDV